ncbi:hypothetical protein ACHQM5_009196 [Ranunculus cassubicifolius]
MVKKKSYRAALTCHLSASKLDMGEQAGVKIEDDIINEFEKKKLGALRSLVETQHDPTSKNVDDMTLRRFLRARNLNVEKAFRQLLNYLKWRQEFVPKGFISESEISNDLVQRKFFSQGRDKRGRSIGVVLGAKHFPKKGGLDELKRCLVYFLDKLCSKLQRGQDTFTVISDLQGWGYSNCDMRASLVALSILQDYYPERLGKLFVVNVPQIFMAVWKLVYPFIDSNTRTKISFVEKSKVRSTLLQKIDESQLPENYGGKLTLVAIEDS